MAGMSPPTIPERPVPVYGRDELRALLRVTAGQGFDERRDHALVRMFIATGCRLGEMAGMTLERLAHDEQAVLVIGKGDRGRWVPYSDPCAVALDRYLRQRRRHPQGGLEALWIGERGALTPSGITQVLRRPARQAGLSGVRPHRFRHDAAHRALDAGMAEGDLQELMGWRSAQMLARYGPALAPSGPACVPAPRPQGRPVRPALVCRNCGERWGYVSQRWRNRRTGDHHVVVDHRAHDGATSAHRHARTHAGAGIDPLRPVRLAPALRRRRARAPGVASHRPARYAAVLASCAT